jgi:hypothetical protein
VRKLPDENGEVETTIGYIVPPGRYTVRVRFDQEVVETSFELVKDPRITASHADLEKQYQLLLGIRDAHNRVNRDVMRARRIRAQLEWWQTRSDVGEDVRKEAQRLGTELTAIEEIFTNPKQLHDTDRLKMRGGLDGKLADLPHAIAGADAPPTRQARDVFEKHETRVNEVCARLDDLVTTDLAQFDERIRALGVPLIDAHGDA